MAVMGFSWQLGFIIGPGLRGAVLGAAPLALWPLVATICVAGALYAMWMEPLLPARARLTPRRDER